MINLKSSATVGLSSGLLIVILGGLHTVMPISTDLYLPALPTIARDLCVSPGAVQFTLAVFMIGVAIGQIAYGPIADKFGRKKPLLCGLAVYILGALVCAVAPSINILIGGRFVQALGASASAVITPASASDLWGHSGVCYLGRASPNCCTPETATIENRPISICLLGDRVIRW